MNLKTAAYVGTLATIAASGLVAAVMLYQRTMENPVQSAFAGLVVALLISLNILVGRRK